MKKFFHEFKEFALRGNVISLAVGMIIGLAFQDVISSLTNNILSPIIGLFIRQNFDTLSLDLNGATLYYGAFLTSVLNFFVLALVVFFIVKGMNRLLENKDATEKPVKRICPFCKSTVADDAVRCPACTSMLDVV